MGIFSRHRENRRLEDAEEELRKLRRKQEEIEIEWINFLDKAKRMLGRIVKRAELVERAEESEEPAAERQVHLAPPQAPPGGGLSERQRQIQQTILRRRAGG